MKRGLVLAAASLFVTLLAVAPVQAASSQKVNQSDWWGGVTGLPSYVNMYIYVPDSPATKPPILVASHHCQGSASSTYSETRSSFVSLADKNGFIIIFPEATGQNCWDVGSKRSLQHDGKGDTHAIAQMVRYTLTKYDADPGRVYAFGGSSGAMMTQALMGVYPDIFMGGVAISGVACGCWAEQYNDVTGDGNTAQWSGPCAGGNVTKTAQQWGDLVRSYFPGYTGHRPRVQLWHGTSDTTVNYKNNAESIKEWTNLLDLETTPTSTDTQKSGYTHQVWKNSCDFVVLENWQAQGVGHGVNFDTGLASAFLGLDKAGGQDPETAACPGAVPGIVGIGTGGATGAGGSTGAGGATGIRDGGLGGSDSGQDIVASSGGRQGSGGTRGTGGDEPAGGQTGSGGAVSSGGRVANGGAVTSGGSASAGGSQTSGGANGQGGSSAVGSSQEAASGCACALGNRAEDHSTHAAFLLVVALALVLRRRKRRTG